MIKVVLGDHNIVKVEGFEQIFNVSLIIKHYQYNYWILDNDIMLLKVRNMRTAHQGCVWDAGNVYFVNAQV